MLEVLCVCMCMYSSYMMSYVLIHFGFVVVNVNSEWCEWFTYQQWLADGVDLRQILVETHNAPMPNAQNFFFDLHDHGYVIFSKEANYINSASGVEFAFLKLRKDFFINNTMYHQLPPRQQQQE